MNSPNLQKLITSFLILAALTSSFVFLLSNTNIGAPANPTGQGVNQITLNGKSAFVEKYPGLAGYTSPLLARSDLGTIGTGDVTNTFTTQLVQQLMAANPDGPNLASANPLVLPKNFGDMGGMSNLVSLSFEPQLQNKKIKLSGKNTPEDILNYLTVSKSTLTDVLVPAIAQLSSQSLSLQSLGDISAMYDSAENKIYQLPVPAVLSGFNRALLGFIDVQKSFFDQTDPAKTLIALQSPQLVLAPYKKALDLEINKLNESLPKLLSLFNAKDKNANILNAILGIQTAYAWDFIGGISGIYNAVLKALSNVYDYISKALAQVQWLQKLLTEYLKNVLVKKLAAQTVQWVQGGGKPQFVTNWQGFLGDSFNTAASGVISKYAPGLCSSFRPLVQVALTPVQVDYSALNNPYSCTPDIVGRNLTDLQNSFADGGWVAYSYMLQPNNNIYGSLVQLSAASNQAGSQAADASKNSANSASGFLSTKDCVDKQTLPSEDLGGGIASESDARAALGNNFIAASCSGGSCTITFCNPDNPNAWQETTPGKLVSDTLSKNLGGSPLERIVNAQDLTGLLNALVNSALTKLVSLGQKGLTGLTADKLAADNGSLADTCNGLTGTALTTCQAENESASSTVNSTSASTKSSVISELQSVLEFKGQLLGEANTIVSLVDQSIIALNQASSTCANTLNESSSTLDGANTLSFIAINIDQLMDASSTYQGIMTDLTIVPAPPGKDKTIARLSELMSHLKSDDIRWVATNLGMTIPATGDERQQTEQFYNNLSGAIDTDGSPFSKIFGTLSSVGNDVSDAKIFVTKLSMTVSCGILEKAKALYTLTINGRPACSIAAIERACNAPPR